jgi:hypothetical protein
MSKGKHVVFSKCNAPGGNCVKSLGNVWFFCSSVSTSGAYCHPLVHLKSSIV